MGIFDVHGELNSSERKYVELEMRQAARLRALEMQDIDYDAAVALLAFIGSKPKGIALSGEIVSLLREKPYNFSLKHIADLLKYLSQSKFVCVGGVVERRHPLGNLPIQLSSMLERKESTTIH